MKNEGTVNDTLEPVESESELPADLREELDRHNSARMLDHSIGDKEPGYSSSVGGKEEAHLPPGYTPIYSHVDSSRLTAWKGWDKHEMLLAEMPGNPSPQDVDDLLVFLAELGIDDVLISVGQGVAIKREGYTYVITKQRATIDFVTTFLRKIRQMDSVDSRVRSGEPDIFAYQVSVNVDRGQYARYRFAAISDLDPHGGYDSILLVGRSQEACPPSAEEINLPQEVIDIFESGKGVVWITGETGSGKSTTLAAIVRKRVQGVGGNIISFEDPPEYLYSTIPDRKRNVVVSQIQVGVGVKTWADAAAYALRLNPDVIIFGECRDEKTMSTCLLMGKTGHTVYSTLHTKGVSDYVARMMDSLDAAGEQFSRANFSNNVISNTLGVVHQRLLPKRGGGRVPVFEYLKMTKELRESIMDLPPEKIYSALSKATNEHGHTLEADLAQKKHLIEEEAFNQTLGDVQTRGENGS